MQSLELISLISPATQHHYQRHNLTPCYNPTPPFLIYFSLSDNFGFSIMASFLTSQILNMLSGKDCFSVQNAKTFWTTVVLSSEMISSLTDVPFLLLRPPPPSLQDHPVLCVVCAVDRRVLLCSLHVSAGHMSLHVPLCVRAYVYVNVCRSSVVSFYKLCAKHARKINLPVCLL